jgi:hypothetical protein
MTTLITNGTVVSATGSTRADVLIDGETIVAVLAPGTTVLGPITADTVIVLREHLAATVDRVGQRSVLRSRAADFPVTEDDAAPVKALLAQGRARADELGLELARRLVLAGLAVVE